MTVYDKARWQLEGGIPERKVLDHFKFIFKWLKKHDLLSDDGKEIEEIGIDDSVSLTDALVTPAGKKFLDMYYDEYLRTIDYGVTENEKWLDDNFNHLS